MTAVGQARPIDTKLAVAPCPLGAEKRTNGQTSRYVRLVPIAS